MGMDSMDNAQRKAVDWSKPIEAVHVDGRVQNVSFVPYDGGLSPAGQPDASGDYYTSPVSDTIIEIAIWQANGDTWDENSPGWTIRNVQTPKAATPAIDPTLVERMVALVRELSKGIGLKEHAQARDIMNALEPIDPDLAAAQKLVAWYSEDIGYPIDLALAAIRRGRQLERGEE